MIMGSLLALLSGGVNQMLATINEEANLLGEETEELVEIGRASCRERV